jgi:hypothetical protein
MQIIKCKMSFNFKCIITSMTSLLGVWLWSRAWQFWLQKLFIIINISLIFCKILRILLQMLTILPVNGGKWQKKSRLRIVIVRKNVVFEKGEKWAVKKSVCIDIRKPQQRPINSFISRKNNIICELFISV